jgi:Peptidase family M28
MYDLYIFLLPLPKIINFLQMKRTLKYLSFFWITQTCFAQNQFPVIENLSSTVNWATNTLTITYDVADADGDNLDIALQFSNDQGKTYVVNSILNPSGDLGFPIQASANKTIICDVSSLSNTNGTFMIRLIADDKQPIDIQTLVNQVDSNRLKSDMDFVEGKRHRTSNPTHLQETRDSLQHHFESLGLFTNIHTFIYSNYAGKNIIGSFPGISNPNNVVIVDAHYDSVANSPGADDNASGTIGVMEIARVLSQYPSKKSMRFIGFDLEEAGLIGSTRYVTNGIDASETIDGVLNLEMIGYYSDLPNTQELPFGFNILFPDATNAVINNQYRGDFLNNVGNLTSLSLFDLFNSTAAQYVPQLKVISLLVSGNGEIAPDLRRSDHAPFWESDRKALMLTDGSEFRNNNYHLPGDISGALNFTFMSNVVKATLATMASLVEVQHADWATTSFSNTVGLQNVFKCEWSIKSRINAENQLFVQHKGCLPNEALLEIFDEKGALILSQNVALINEFETNIHLNASLAKGFYFAKISTEEGQFSQKLLIN